MGLISSSFKPANFSGRDEYRLKYRYEHITEAQAIGNQAVAGAWWEWDAFGGVVS